MVKKPTVDDYVQNGILGDLQTKPEERKRFLGTIRERIVIALTTSQVRRKTVYTEVEEKLKQHKKATIYLNGDLDYAYLSKYVKLATRMGVSYSTVTNLEQTTDIGLVVAYDYAVDEEEIFVKEAEVGEQVEEENDGFSIVDSFKQLFTSSEKK